MNKIEYFSTAADAKNEYFLSSSVREAAGGGGLRRLVDCPLKKLDFFCVFRYLYGHGGHPGEGGQEPELRHQPNHLQRTG